MLYDIPLLNQWTSMAAIQQAATTAISQSIGVYQNWGHFFQHIKYYLNTAISQVNIMNNYASI